MTTTPAAAAFRAELSAALVKLEPQIRGLHHRALLPVSPGLAAAFQQEIADHERRRNKEQAVIAALDDLEADDYPNMPLHELPPDLSAELAQIEADDAAADAEFQTRGQAVSGTATFPDPVLKGS